MLTSVAQYCKLQNKWKNYQTGFSSKLVTKAVGNHWNVSIMLQVAIGVNTFEIADFVVKCNEQDYPPPAWHTCFSMYNKEDHLSILLPLCNALQCVKQIYALHHIFLYILRFTHAGWRNYKARRNFQSFAVRKEYACICLLQNKSPRLTIAEDVKSHEYVSKHISVPSGQSPTLQKLFYYMNYTLTCTSRFLANHTCTCEFRYLYICVHLPWLSSYIVDLLGWFLLSLIHAYVDCQQVPPAVGI